jgi:NDP-sugar pyrophosphorylase family protein
MKPSEKNFSNTIMQIKSCLILAAGFGTRMGVIGRKLPKVLWPVFEKSLLELQVAYAKSLGIEKIFINLHYMGEEIEQFAQGKSIFEDVTFLWEKPEILDIGGAIHQLARRKEINYHGHLLVLNADQFFYIPKERLSQLVKPYGDFGSVLFTYWVNSSLGYNALEINSDRIVQSIVKNKDLAPDARVETYTGISLINLSKLNPVAGASAFFDSVAPFQERSVPAILLEGIDYWDFGTLRRYWETSFRILETYRNNSNHPFLRFLVGAHALKTWKIDLQRIAYHAAGPRVINLNPDKLGEGTPSSIHMAGAMSKKHAEYFIYWNDLDDEVKFV